MNLSSSAPLLPILQMLQDDILPREFILDDTICTIGRSRDCSIVINRHMVSRVHAKIEQLGTRYILTDLESANGTFLDGVQIREPHILSNGAGIGIASSAPMIRFIDPEATERPFRRLAYDAHQRRFVYLGMPLDLSPQQRELLMYLFENIGRLCSQADCIEAVWGMASRDDINRRSSLFKTISELRAAFKIVDPHGEPPIESKRNDGYRLIP